MELERERRGKGGEGKRKVGKGSWCPHDFFARRSWAHRVNGAPAHCSREGHPRPVKMRFSCFSYFRCSKTATTESTRANAASLEFSRASSCESSAVMRRSLDRGHGKPNSSDVDLAADTPSSAERRSSPIAFVSPPPTACESAELVGLSCQTHIIRIVDSRIECQSSTTHPL